jgi:hypothetical protein
MWSQRFGGPSGGEHLAGPPAFFPTAPSSQWVGARSRVQVNRWGGPQKGRRERLPRSEAPAQILPRRWTLPIVFVPLGVEKVDYRVGSDGMRAQRRAHKRLGGNFAASTPPPPPAQDSELTFPYAVNTRPRARAQSAPLTISEGGQELFSIFSSYWWNCRPFAVHLVGLPRTRKRCA